MKKYEDPLHNNNNEIVAGPPASQMTPEWLESLRAELEGLVTRNGGTLDGNTTDEIDKFRVKTSQIGKGDGNRLMGEGAFGIGDPILLDSSDNLNDVTTPGHYYWGSSVPENTPTGDPYESMRVWNGGEYLIFQDVNTND